MILSIPDYPVGSSPRLPICPILADVPVFPILDISIFLMLSIPIFPILDNHDNPIFRLLDNFVFPLIMDNPV